MAGGIFQNDLPKEKILVSHMDGFWRRLLAMICLGLVPCLRPHALSGCHSCGLSSRGAVHCAFGPISALDDYALVSVQMGGYDQRISFGRWNKRSINRSFCLEAGGSIGIQSGHFFTFLGNFLIFGCLPKDKLPKGQASSGIYWLVAAICAGIVGVQPLATDSRGVVGLNLKHFETLGVLMRPSFLYVSVWRDLQLLLANLLYIVIRGL